MAQNANILSILQQDTNYGGNLQQMESTAPDENDTNINVTANTTKAQSSEDFDTLVKAVIYFAN